MKVTQCQHCFQVFNFNEDKKKIICSNCGNERIIGYVHYDEYKQKSKIHWQKPVKRERYKFYGK